MNDKNFAIHARAAGERTFCQRREADVVEVFSGDVLARDATQFKDTIDACRTLEETARRSLAQVPGCCEVEGEPVASRTKAGLCVRSCSYCARRFASSSGVRSLSA